MNEQARATFDRALEVESRYWGVHNEYGNFLYDLSRYEEALERYQRVIDLVPASGVGYDNLGNTYLALGDFDRALAVFDSSPLPSRWTFMNRGLLHYYRRDFAMSAEDQLRAIEISPEVHTSWGQLGDAYRFVPGREEDSRAAYREAIRLAEEELDVNPDEWNTLARLNMYYVHIGEDELAKAGLERLDALTSDPTASFFSAIVCLDLGDKGRAYEYLHAVAEAGWSPATLLGDPDISKLVGEPEFEEIIATIRR